MFKEALLEADRKDKEYNETGRTEGDFWGLPSCFKGTPSLVRSILVLVLDMDKETCKMAEMADNYAVEGYDMTLGTSPYVIDFKGDKRLMGKGQLPNLSRTKIWKAL